MNKMEQVIISAYTGILMCDFQYVHEYIEQKLGRPVFTHELAEKSVWEEIKETTRDDFLKLCSND